MELAPLPGFDEGLPPEERQAKWRALLENTMKAFPPKKEVMAWARRSRRAPTRTPTPWLRKRQE